jgi:hypothetical protein
VPRIANVLPVYYATVIGPSCFVATEVRFVALGFVAIIQVKGSLHYIVIVFLLSEREIGLIHVSFLTIG